MSLDMPSQRKSPVAAVKPGMGIIVQLSVGRQRTRNPRQTLRTRKFFWFLPIFHSGALRARRVFCAAPCAGA
jgi:hypothetical protein